MKAIGIDIGTTTICGVIIETENGKVLEKITSKNQAFLQAGSAYERLQDPGRIIGEVIRIYQTLSAKQDGIACVGLTGQMHGILYLDQSGEAVSPLYTWQDGRGDLPYQDSQTYADWLTGKTGYPMATGYGITTHFYHQVHGTVPENAACFCTIADYAAMKLSGGNRPVLHPTNAASLGCFRLEKQAFDAEALEKAGVLTDLFPQVRGGCPVSGMLENVPVAIAIGDNQASSVGSVRDAYHTLLVNVGTGSQVSVAVQELPDTREMDARPYPDGGYLLAGSSLCGGRAYAALEKFFRQTVEMAVGQDPGSLYGRMEALLEQRGLKSGTLVADTRFCGTRSQPDLRGSFTQVDLENFTPAEWTYSILSGIVEELYQSFRQIRSKGNFPDGKLLYFVGSGNGIRKNRFLRQLLETRFEMKMQIPAHQEEAAYGAALFALVAAGIFPSVPEAQRIIQYQS